MKLTIATIAQVTAGRLAQGTPTATLTGVSTDSRTIAPGQLFVAIKGERFDGHQFVRNLTKAGGALVERWPLEAPPELPIVVVDDTVAAYGRLAAWWRRQMPARVIALTGSNGKTTTKDMLAHVLGALAPTVASLSSHNNHIGVPETLLRIRPEHAFAVVEIGTNHFGEVPALASLVEPDVALITNIGPSHLEAFGSEEGVAREKGRLLDYLRLDGLAVLHADDPWSRRLAVEANARVVTFGLSPAADWRASEIQEGDEEISFVVEPVGCRVTLPAVGRCHVSNCLAAMAIAVEMGVPPARAAERMRSFSLPKWRMQLRRIGSITLIADCYNANPASMEAAIGELARRPTSGRRVAVVGDMLELGKVAEEAHRRLGRRLAEAGVQLLCAVGQNALFAAQEAVTAGLPLGQVFWTLENTEAAEWLTRRLGEGDTVLVKGSRAMRLEEVADAVANWARSTMAPSRGPSVVATG